MFFLEVGCKIKKKEEEAWVCLKGLGIEKSNTRIFFRVSTEIYKISKLYGKL